MGNQFSRVAYSSRGERFASTHAEELLDTGLDLTRFARGLSAQYSTSEPRRAELGHWRFGRALVELGDPAVESAVEAIARASDVDEYNRLRATIIIAFTEVARARSEDRDIGGDEIALAVKTRLGSMSWSAQRWLDLFAQVHDD
jgi:hypothetical protein